MTKAQPEGNAAERKRRVKKRLAVLLTCLLQAALLLFCVVDLTEIQQLALACLAVFFGHSTQLVDDDAAQLRLARQRILHL